MTGEAGRATLLVIDSGPLQALVSAGALEVLHEFVVGAPFRAVIPGAVDSEIRRARPRYPENSRILDASWLEVAALDLERDRDRQAYVRASEGLVMGERNRGEAEALAYASLHGAVLLADDRKAVRRASSMRPPVERIGTLTVLLRECRRGSLAQVDVAGLYDAFVENGYAPVRLWRDSTAFLAWAVAAGRI